MNIKTLNDNALIEKTFETVEELAARLEAPNQKHTHVVDHLAETKPILITITPQIINGIRSRLNYLEQVIETLINTAIEQTDIIDNWKKTTDFNTPDEYQTAKDQEHS